MTLRAKLRETVTNRFLPELKRRGFVGPEKIRGNAIFHDFSRSRNGMTERLGIQFEKRQKPRFILNAWVEPPDGIDGLIKREETLLQGRISPGGGLGTGAWFRADRPWWQRLFASNSSLEEEAVDQALAKLDAIEDWFQNPQETKIVRVLSIHYRNPEKKTTDVR
jgi:hypothetical protein